jgi:hypothetical protein
VLQTRFYEPGVAPDQQRGNCLTAVVASLLDLPIEAVPNFVQDDVDHGNDDPEWNWWTRLHRFVRAQGHALHYVRAFPDQTNLSAPEPGEFYAVIGVSPRDPQVHHIVIYRDGVMVHDPHPDGTGLATVTDEWHWTLRPVRVLEEVGARG